MQIDTSTIIAFLALLGLPSALTAFLFRRFENRMVKRDEARKKHEILVVQCINALFAVTELTAKSMQKLDKELNGDMTDALDYCREVKHEQRIFLQQQGVENFM